MYNFLSNIFEIIYIANFICLHFSMKFTELGFPICRYPAVLFGFPNDFGSLFPRRRFKTTNASPEHCLAGMANPVLTVGLPAQPRQPPTGSLRVLTWPICAYLLFFLRDKASICFVVMRHNPYRFRTERGTRPMGGSRAIRVQRSAAFADTHAIDKDGWVIDLRYDDPANGSSVIYVLEDWTPEKRALKAFCPNPTRFPEMWLVPERFKLGSFDIESTTDEVRFKNGADHERWLTDTIGVCKQIASCDEGRRLLNSIGHDPISIPSSVKELIDWLPEDGLFTICDEHGKPLDGKRKSIFSLIMCTSATLIRAGTADCMYQISPNRELGFGQRGIVIFDPKVTVRLGPRIDENGQATQSDAFLFACQCLAHEMIHLDHLLKGIMFPDPQLKKVTYEVYNKTAGKWVSKTVDEFIYPFGNPVYEPPLCDSKIINEELHFQPYCAVSPEEASTTTLEGFRTANGNYHKAATIKPATANLQIFNYHCQRASDVPQQLKISLKHNIDARIGQFSNLPFVEEAISFHILTTLKVNGGPGLTTGEALRHIRHTYTDAEGGLSLKKNPTTGKWKAVQFYYNTDNPLNPRRANITKTGINVAQCKGGGATYLTEAHADLCMPELEKEPPPDLRNKFEALKPEDFDNYAREVLKRLKRDGTGPEELRPRFVDRRSDLRFHPSSEHVGLKNLVLRLNEGLGKVAGPLGFRLWAEGLMRAFGADADDLSKAAAATGIIPVIGDLMGILDGAVHGNWEEVGLSGVGMLVLLARNSAPLLEEVAPWLGEALLLGSEGLDLALGIFMVVITLVELFSDAFDELQDMRRGRDKNWWNAMTKHCDTVVLPKMEEGWRLYEQNLLLDYSLAVATVEAVAAEATKSAKDDTERRKIQTDAVVAMEELHQQFGWLLVDTSVGFQTLMQNTLRFMLSDQGNYADFNRQYVETWATRSGVAEWNNCVDSGGPPLGHCLDLKNRQYEDEIAAGAVMITDPVPVKVPQDIWDLFDKEGRFFPRMLPSLIVPAPHVTGGAASEQWDHKAVVQWAPLKTLPGTLVSKMLLRIEGDGVKHTEPANHRQANFTDPKSTEMDPKHHEIKMNFETPDIAGIPQVDDPTRRIDRKLIGSSSFHWHVVDGGLRDVDLSNIPHNYGYGSLIGDYVIINEQTGLALDLRYDALSDSATLESRAPTGSYSQIWKVQFTAPTVDTPDRWSYSSMLNANSGKSLALSQDGRLILTAAEPGNDNQLWFLTTTAEYAGFTLRNKSDANKSVSPGDSGTSLRLGNDLSNKSEGRWRFMPATAGTPVTDRYYMFINDWSGLALDVSDVVKPELRTPCESSPHQVFHLDRGYSSAAEAIVLHNLFHSRYLQLATDAVQTTEYISSATCFIRPAWGGAWKIAAPDGRVLESSDRNPGAVLLASEDASHPGQLWRLAEALTTPPLGWCIITAAGRGLALAIQGPGATDGQKAQLEPLSDTNPQRWALARNDDERHTITFLTTNGQLAPLDASNADSTAIVLYQDPEPAASGQWALCPTPAGTWVIRNSANGKVLEADAPLDDKAPADKKDRRKTAVAGAAIVQRDFVYKSNGQNIQTNTNQLWSLNALPTPQVMVGLT